MYTYFHNRFKKLIFVSHIALLCQCHCNDTPIAAVNAGWKRDGAVNNICNPTSSQSP